MKIVPLIMLKWRRFPEQASAVLRESVTAVKIEGLNLGRVQT